MASIKPAQLKMGTPQYTAEIRLKGYPPQTAIFRRKTDANKWIQDTESAMRRIVILRPLKPRSIKWVKWLTVTYLPQNLPESRVNTLDSI